MTKKFFTFVLAMRNYKLIGYKKGVVVGYNKDNNMYAFWVINEFKRLVLFDTCRNRDEAEFKYTIIGR